ncbi:hypothetical protein [Luteibacter sp. 329MFSha]|uniref:hypothetical protein n=1 Tax=Luteibacter sp. 329MFSha TaxID=1798239 RepID=UPI0008D49C57|nr:hypothetical protein [Luteibacter sp. 329MFSha]SEV93945.1 hypothetical protein SAMN04515660_1145 [Luteibacter sp. 329MFSha]
MAQGDGRLPRPAIAEAGSGDVLDLSTLDGDPRATVAPWPLIAEGQTCWLAVDGTREDGMADHLVLRDGAAVTPAEVDDGLELEFDRSRIETWQDGTSVIVTFKANLREGDETGALLFPPRTYRLKRVSLPPLTITGPTSATVGDTLTYGAQDGVPPYSFATGNAAVATLSAQGTGRAVSAGTAAITATDTAGSSTSLSLNVAAPTKPDMTPDYYEGATTGVRYEFSASGGVPPYRWSLYLEAGQHATVLVADGPVGVIRVDDFGNSNTVGVYLDDARSQFDVGVITTYSGRSQTAVNAVAARRSSPRSAVTHAPSSLDEQGTAPRNPNALSSSTKSASGDHSPVSADLSKTERVATVDQQGNVAMLAKRMESLRSSHVSEPRPLIVGTISPGDRRLPSPLIPQADADQLLDLSTFDGDAQTTVQPWSLISEGQTVWLVIDASREDGQLDHFVARDGAPVTHAEVDDGLRIDISRTRIESWKDGSVFSLTLNVNFAHGDLTNATPFPLRAYSLKKPAPLAINGPSSANVGDNLSYSAEGGNVPYTFASANTAIATLSTQGSGTAVAAGTTHVSVTDARNVRAEMALTVTAHTPTFDVLPLYQAGVAGGTYYLNASGGAPPYRWELYNFVGAQGALLNTEGPNCAVRVISMADGGSLWIRGSDSGDNAVLAYILG